MSATPASDKPAAGDALEQLKALEKDLFLELDRLETQIAEEEDRYVQQTGAAGNVLIGYEYVEGHRREKKARLFSESSASWSFPRKQEEARRLAVQQASGAAGKAGATAGGVKGVKNLAVNPAKKPVPKAGGGVVAGKKRPRNEIGGAGIGIGGDDDGGSEYDASDFTGGAAAGAQFTMPDFGLQSMLRADSDFGGADSPGPLPPGALMGMPVAPLGGAVASKGAAGNKKKSGTKAGKKGSGWDY